MYINPPMNYTGSKFKLLPQILPLMDYSKTTFVDLFAGGGSVYANVIDKYQKIVINDIIEDLVLLHAHLILVPKNIIIMTKKVCQEIVDKESYVEVRQQYNDEKHFHQLWALMLCCTNNMLRFNKKFKFNQTYGKRNWNKNTTKKISDFINHFKDVDKTKLKFRALPFDKLIISEDYMVYLDPPYINTEAGYNCYWSKEKTK